LAPSLNQSTPHHTSLRPISVLISRFRHVFEVINFTVPDEEYKLKGRHSSVGIATGWTAGVRLPEIYVYFTASRPALGAAQRPIQWVQRALSPEAKRQEVKLTTPTSAEVKNACSYAPLTHTSSRRGAQLIKYRDILNSLSLRSKYFLQHLFSNALNLCTYLKAKNKFIEIQNNRRDQTICLC
jgi:hypothetical protein